MQIQIDTLLLPTLERISTENGLSPEDYATNIVKSFLESQYRGELLDEIKDSSIEKIDEIKKQIKSKQI